MTREPSRNMCLLITETKFVKLLAAVAEEITQLEKEAERMLVSAGHTPDGRERDRRLELRGKVNTDIKVLHELTGDLRAAWRQGGKP